MADILPSAFGGRLFSVFSQSFGKDEEGEATKFEASSKHQQPAGKPVARRQPSRSASESRSTAVALLWLATFAAAEFVFNQPHLMPLVPGTGLQLISVPVALFALGLMLRPVSEAPLYCLIFVLASVQPELGSPDFDFVLARVAVETFQTVAIVCVTVRFFWTRLGDPLAVAMWAAMVLSITAAGAGLTVALGSAIPFSPGAFAREWGGSDAMAWRIWWLGSACSYMSVGAPAAALVTLRHRLAYVLSSPGWER